MTTVTFGIAGTPQAAGVDEATWAKFETTITTQIIIRFFARGGDA